MRSTGKSAGKSTGTLNRVPCAFNVITRTLFITITVKRPNVTDGRKKYQKT